MVMHIRFYEDGIIYASVIALDLIKICKWTLTKVSMNQIA